MKKLLYILMTGFMVLSIIPAVHGEKRLFCYKFRPGEYLTYQTRRQDSVLFDHNSSASREINIRLRETLEIQKSSPDVHHTIAYHLDTLDISPASMSDRIAELDLLQHFRKQFTDTLIYMSTNGYPLLNEGHFQYNQLTLPLSEFPLELNEGWEFEFDIPDDPDSPVCTSVVFGHGMLYDFIEEDTRILARFIINATQLFEGRCSPNGNTTVNREGVIEATHLVYFDEERGIITKIITDQVIQEKRFTRKQNISLTIKTKSTTELLDWDMERPILQSAALIR